MFATLQNSMSWILIYSRYKSIDANLKNTADPTQKRYYLSLHVINYYSFP